jgi:hypothetical protein
MFQTVKHKFANKSGAESSQRVEGMLEKIKTLQ